MKPFVVIALSLIALIFNLPTAAQQIEVNRQNRTIAVIAEDSITADPEIGFIVVGYHNYGPTKDAAFQDNVRVAKQITRTLSDANVPKETIETRTLELQRVEPDEKWTPEMKRDRQFEARQSWVIRIPTAQVGPLIASVTKGGANEISGLSWNVIDSAALQAKASGAALAKARGIADQMAKGLGTRLGDLVYASNKSPVNDNFVESFWQRQDAANRVYKFASDPGFSESSVEIYPQKVKSTATVFAVFAIE